MPQVQNNPWKRTVSNWVRLVQRKGELDEETGKPEIIIEEVPVTMIHECLGTTDLYAESEQVLEGLRKVHIHAIRY